MSELVEELRGGAGGILVKWGLQHQLEEFYLICALCVLVEVIFGAYLIFTRRITSIKDDVGLCLGLVGLWQVMYYF